jgi:hypothetical protein
VPGGATVYPSILADSSFDNCAVWTYSPAAKTYNSLGVFNLLITVKDWTGNAATCTSVVTVVPNGPEERPDDSLTTKETLKMAVFPNPAAGDVTVEFQLHDAEPFTLRVFDMLGNLAFSREETGVPGHNTVLLRRDALLPGVYFLDLQLKKLQAKKRLIVRE